MSSPIIAYLAGTWPDGAPTAAPFAPAPGLGWTIYVLTDGVVQLTVRNADGSVKDISGFEIVMFVSWRTTGRLATLTDPTNGICTFDFAQSDTDGIAPKVYTYSISGTSAGVREVLSVIGTVTVGAALGTPTAPVDSYTPSLIVGYGLPGTTGASAGDTLAIQSTSPLTLEWASPPVSIASPYFDARAYGATGDGTTDDAPAVGLALQAAIDAGGGMVWLAPRQADGSQAVYAWKSAVSVNCQPGGIGPAAILSLYGPGAVVLMTCTLGSEYVGCTVQNADLFAVEGIRFYGTMDTAAPSTPPVYIKGVISGGTLNVTNCEFNGFMIYRNPGSGALATDNAVIFASSLVIRRSKFAACGGSGRPVIKIRDYTDARLEDVTMIDFYTINTVNMSPATADYPFSGFVAYTPVNTTGVSQFGASSVTFNNVRFDEGTGGYYHVVIDKSGGPALPFFRYCGGNEGVSPASASVGVYLDGVSKAEIGDWFIRGPGGAGTKGLYARNVEELTAWRSRTDGAAPITAIDVDSTVGVLRLVDSHLAPAGSSAVQTYVEKSATPANLFNYTNSTRPTASSMRPGALIWNSQTSQVQVSDGSSWLVVGP